MHHTLFAADSTYSGTQLYPTENRFLNAEPVDVHTFLARARTAFAGFGLNGDGKPYNLLLHARTHQSGQSVGVMHVCGHKVLARYLTYGVGGAEQSATQRLAPLCRRHLLKEPLQFGIVVCDSIGHGRGVTVLFVDTLANQGEHPSVAVRFHGHHVKEMSAQLPYAPVFIHGMGVAD